MLRRLDHAGLLPAGSDAARQAIPQDEMAALLAYAAADSAETAADVYLHEFNDEFTPRAGAVDLSTLAFYDLRENHVLAGVGFDTVWTGARADRDVSTANAVVRASFASPHIGLAAGVDRDHLNELQAVLGLGAIGVWAGRRELGYGVGQGGGIVLDHTRLDGAGVFLERPLRLPVVGPIRFEMHVSQIENVLNYLNVQRTTDPYFWTARGTIEPHPRVRLGLSRGMIFGGEGNVEVTAGRVLGQLVGIYTSDEDDDSFAAQTASIDVRVILRKGRMPASAYVEWGADDGYGAVWRTPGITAGIEFSALPARDIAFGIERTEFVRSNGLNGHWYQNAWFRGGWADGGSALGHPLGGHGREWRVFVNGGAPVRGITAAAAVYQRWRGDNNLFSPQRHGTSAGAAGNIDARITKLIRVVVAGEFERGSNDWDAATARAGLRFVF